MAEDIYPLEIAHTDYFNDTSSHTGKWFKLICPNITTFTILGITNFNATPTGVALPAGTEIIGDIRNFRLTSAVPILAYSLKEQDFGAKPIDVVNVQEYVRVVLNP